jgi:hypothetical protein
LAAPGSRFAAALACVALALAACGSGERTFTAQEFVDDANAKGAHLALGEPLSTSEADTELYALRVEAPDSGDGGTDLPALGDEAGSGSLRVEGSSGAAEAEYERCEQAGLLCYRAANVVLVFEADVDPDSLAELARAIRALKAD